MNEHSRAFAYMSDTSPGFSARDFLRMMQVGAFEDMRTELVGGIIEKMMPAFMSHGESNGRVFVKLVDAFNGLPYKLGIDIVIAVDDFTIRAADIAVTVPDLPGDRAAYGSEVLLAVEIADTTLARDLGLKASDYARAGIAEYWVVDLRGSVVHVMREPGSEGYASRQVVPFDSSLTVPCTDRAITID